MPLQINLNSDPFATGVLQANVNATPGVAPGSADIDVKSLSGIPDVFAIKANINPPSSTTAVIPAIHGSITYPAGAAAMTGGSHAIGVLGFLHQFNTSQTMPLGIGAEGKVETAFGTTMTTAIGVDNNLLNAGTVTAGFCSYSAIINSGTITSTAYLSGNVDSNTGTIGTLYGLLFGNVSSPGTISGSMIGVYFASQGFAGAKYCLFCADPAALLYTIGSIRSDANTRTETFQLGSGTKTATAVTGAATLDKASGKITTEALTTAAGAAYTLTLTNSQIAAADTVYAALAWGTNSAGLPVITRITPAAGSVVIIVSNMHATVALNGTLVISFASMKV